MPFHSILHSFSGAATIVPLMAFLVTATPIPQTDPTSICSLSDSSAATWRQTPATQFMSNWFAANGTAEWLTAMDNGTTQIPGFQSQQRCEDTGGTCDPPSGDCKIFTPPEFYFIRRAASNANKVFARTSERFSNKVLAESLRLDQLIDDLFTALPSDENQDELDAINLAAAFFAAASPVFGLAGLFGLAGAAATSTALSPIGGMLNLQAKFITATGVQDRNALRSGLKAGVGDNIDAVTKGLIDINLALFGGAGRNFDLTQLIDTLRGAGQDISQDTNLDPITRLFDSGMYLEDTSDGAIEDAANKAVQKLRQGVASNFLTSAGFYVYVDTTVDQNSCSGTGTVFLQDQGCFILHHRLFPAESNKPDTTIMNGNVLEKFTNDLGIDLTAMYQNMLDCNGGANGALDVTFAFDDSKGGFPKCFWNVPIVKNSGPRICSLLGDAEKANLPDKLKVNRADCGKTVCTGGFFGKGC